MKPEGHEGGPLPPIRFEKTWHWGIPIEHAKTEPIRAASSGGRRRPPGAETISIVSLDSPKKKGNPVSRALGGVMNVVTSALTFFGRIAVMKPIELLRAGKTTSGLGYLAAEAALLAAITAAGGIAALTAFLAWAGITVAASVPAYAWQRLVLKNYDQKYLPYPEQERIREDWQRLKKRKPRKKRKKDAQLELDL
jgi:hypothetical protein